MPRKPTQIVQLKLRIQERLRREVEKRAKKSGRSLNAELVTLIEAAIAMGSFEDIAEKLREQIEQMERLREKPPEDA
jgi:hypothetical protein